MTDYFVGLMSGTSIDSIDAALVSISDGNIQLIAAVDFPIPAPLQNQLLAFCHDTQAAIDDLGKCDREIALLFAQATQAVCTQANITLDQVTAVGSHGQTIRHRPNSENGGPFTWQMGDPNVIAAQTGIDVVADFRRMDMAVGGQAAPLAPLFHEGLFAHSEIARTIINIGGISNVTHLKPNTAITGFDLGPGNALMDAWIQQHKSERYDKSGHWARSGEVIPELLNNLLQHPFFAAATPKSTGREDFNLPWLQPHISQLNTSPTPADVQATLLELTAQSITLGIKKDIGDEVYICGGGAYNDALMNRLSELLAPTPVTDTKALGVAPEWVEACGFAMLAYRRVNKIASQCPSVTGSRRASILGGFYSAYAHI